jgi:hypothetical protein
MLLCGEEEGGSLRSLFSFCVCNVFIAALHEGWDEDLISGTGKAGTVILGFRVRPNGEGCSHTFRKEGRDE